MPFKVELMGEYDFLNFLFHILFVLFIYDLVGVDCSYEANII